MNQREVTVCTVDSGLHDLILSELKYHNAAYSNIFSFIRSTTQTTK